MYECKGICTRIYAHQNFQILPECRQAQGHYKRIFGGRKFCNKCQSRRYYFYNKDHPLCLKETKFFFRRDINTDVAILDFVLTGTHCYAQKRHFGLLCSFCLQEFKTTSVSELADIAL